MALFTHPGTGSVELGVAGTKRDDISDYLMASLILAPNVLGSLKGGPEFSDSICKWTEDKLNPDTVVETTGGGISSGATTMNFSASDWAALQVGNVLADTAANATVGGVGGSEQILITGLTPNTATVTRAFAGTAATAHAASAVFSVIARPTIEGSDLGPDQSRARISKYNYVSRQAIDVMLTSEVINRSRRGYTPGINDELEYQFFQRTQELIRIWNKSVLYSRASPGTNGTTAQSGGDYSTFAGIRAWLDGTFNTTANVIDWSTSYATGGIDSAIDAVNILQYRNGARADWCVVGPLGAQAVGVKYSDRIRIQQDETTRGFAASVFRTTMANEFRLLVDGQVSDTATVGEVYLIDSAKIRTRPLADQFFYVITAPTLRDGDAVRALSKFSLEFRNTGSDALQASWMVKNANFGTV